jgi:hypothetical protein
VCQHTIEPKNCDLHDAVRIAKPSSGCPPLPTTLRNANEDHSATMTELCSILTSSKQTQQPTKITVYSVDFDKILFVDEALFDRDENWPHCAMLHVDCRFGNGDIGIEINHPSSS